MIINGIYFLIGNFFRAAQKLVIYKRWSRRWWRLQINRNSVWDTWVQEKRPSTVASPHSFTHSTAKKEQLALLPDVKKWNESLSIQEHAKGKRPTSVDAQSALSWCLCAFIIRSYVVKLFATFLSVGSWNASYKLLTNNKPSSKAFKGRRERFHSTTFTQITLFDFSLKPVPQFVIPPIHPPSSSPSSDSRRENNSSAHSEPSPKRLRLDDETSSINHEAQHSVLINNVINALVTDQLENAQQPRSTAFV